LATRRAGPTAITAELGGLQGRQAGAHGHAHSLRTSDRAHSVIYRAYIEQAHIQETRRLEYLDPLTQVNRVIEDQTLIQWVISLLQSPDEPCDLSGSGPHDSFLLVLSVPIRTDDKPVDHAVTVDYNPKTGVLSLSNIATGIWPISLQGRYTVPPSFGPALFSILGINPPTAQMVQIRAYRLDTELPRGLSQQLPS